MPIAQAVREIYRTVGNELTALGVYASHHPIPKQVYMNSRWRQALRRRGEDSWATVSLVQVGGEHGVLYWFEGVPALSSRPRHEPAVRVPNGELVEMFQFEKLPPGQIQQYLDQVDDHFNPRKGLWRLCRDGELRPLNKPLDGDAQRLILIHGSLGCGTALLESMLRAPSGREFVAELFARYEEIYFYERPTLSVGATAGAHELMELLRGAGGPVDVVAYCSGGLVAQRFFDAGGGSANRLRMVLVGCPMRGTSMTEPTVFRSGLSLLTNYAVMMTAASVPAVITHPFLLAPLALMRMSLSLGGSGVDRLGETAIMLVPGLADLVRHEREPSHRPAVRASAAIRHAIVRSRFQCESPERQFWKWFRKGAMEHTLARRVFARDNDLLVDTDSMMELRNQRPTAVLEFGPQDGVHHGNYFEQQRTLDFILDQLPVD